MSEIQFEDDVTPHQNQILTHHSKLALFVTNHSGGLIKNPTQAEVLLLAAAVVGIVACIAWNIDSSSTIEEPSKEIINSSQPTRPLP